MKKILLTVLSIISLILSYGQRSSVEEVLGFLLVFPYDLGSYSSEPVNIIKQLNEQSQWGYNTWRLPTDEELSLLRANNYLSEERYMSKETNTSFGRVLLVTDSKSAKNASLEIRLKQAKSNRESFIDLGLPSRKKWRFNAVMPIENNFPDVDDLIEKIKQWGQRSGGWMLTSKQDWDELLSNCTFEWVDREGGYIVTGKNGNVTFLANEADRAYLTSTYVGLTPRGHSMFACFYVYNTAIREDKFFIQYPYKVLFVKY